MAKITDPSKLLPSAKSTTIARVGKPNIIAKTSTLSKGLLATRQPKDIININNKLVKVDKFLKSDLIVSQKKSEVKRKDKEKQDFAEAEKKLETPKTKGLKLPGISLPSLGFMDRVKRFIFFTALGWALPKILEFLPKLQGFSNIVGGVYNFAEGLFGKLFDGFMSLVKFGGDLKDKTLGFIATAKAGVGGNYQKEFDKLEKQFNTFVNASIIAGVLSTDIGVAAVDEYNKWRKKNAEPGKPKPGEPTKTAVKAGTKVTIGQGGKPGLGKGAKVTGGPKPKPSLWAKLTGGLKSKFSKVGGKLAKPFAKFAGAAIPGIGAAVGFMDASARSKSGDKLGAFLAGLSASLDAFTTAVAVAGLASAATGVGLPAAAVLATAATAAGAISMSIDVILLIRDILKAFGVPMFNKGGRIVSKYQGGGTTRGGKQVGTPVRRTITPTKRKPIKVQPAKSQPGKDVGGENVIKDFYYKKSDPYQRPAGGWLSTFNAYTGKVEDKDAERPYKALTTTAKILKDIPLVGGIMGAAVDVALGQKPDIKVYRSLSAGIGYLVESLANQKANQSITSLMKDIQGFADGGTISPSRRLDGINNSMSFGDLIAKVLGPTIDRRVDEAIQSIEKELRKRMQGGEKKSPQDLDMTAGNIKVTSDSPDFWLLVTAALFENGISTDGYQGAADAAQAIYNRVSLPGWPKSIRGVILQPGQFQPVRDYGGVAEWEKINSKESAIAFAKKYKGYSGNIVEKIAATLLDTTKQENARTFVGPRDNFRSDSYEKSNNHLEDSTEKSRYGHTFGFEPRGANIGRFKKGTLIPAEINKEIVSGKVEEMEMGAGYGSAGGKISGELGRFMKKKGVVPGSIHRHPEHPPYSLTSGHSKGSLHYQGRAIDLGGNANEQGPILKAIEEFNKIKGVKPVQLFHAGNDPTGGHNDHVHVAYQGGGLISPKKPNHPIPNSFASYETYGSGMMIAIQPMIIEKQVPVSTRSKAIIFPVPVAVNSNMDNLSFSRG